jgi:hypothetical protein
MINYKQNERQVGKINSNCVWLQELHLNTNTYARLTPVILATQEAEIRRIKIQDQPWQIVLETLSRKY